MKPDGFDTLFLAAAVLLACAALAQGFQGGGTGPTRALQADPEMRRGLDEAGALLESGRPRESQERLQGLAARNPSVAEAHFLLWRALLECRDYPASLREFRLALQLDPDYADPKARQFAGDAIKRAISEGKRHSSTKGLQLPGSAILRRALEDARYLERMLAGGCG